ncbi:hypothetical protein Bca52824_023266 [Brassica carinata]|uniref:Uncharacterized protein n=1 Tax=Brassica carinata TaxID=52824 RepID=A0A8X8ASE1_BRACI|nr:hypothetical protein Bca52824_023266 [Brassica carinata]
MVTSSQEKSQRSKPLLRLETSLHTMKAKRKQVDTSTAIYHPKDEPHKRDFDQHKPPKDRENEKKQEPPQF